MTRNALSFFLEEMEGRGIWRYWTSRTDKRIPPDLDDIACISYLLEKNQVPFPSNVDVILANQNEEGLFRTWIPNLLTPMTSPRWTEWAMHVDCVVNANVLLYLGETSDTRHAIKYLNNIILNNEESDCSQHYIDRLSILHAFQGILQWSFIFKCV